jgi:hypothetical protein
MPACPATPAACRRPTAPGGSRVTLRNDPRDERDRLKWTWGKGEATTRDELGDPTAANAWDLCIYDAGILRAGLVAPAGETCGGSPARPKSCWSGTGSGLTYKDRSLTPSGLAKVSLRAGENGRAAATVAGKGTNLRLFDLAGVTGPLEVQLRRHDGGLCLAATFSAPFDRRDAKTLSSRSD